MSKTISRPAPPLMFPSAVRKLMIRVLLQHDTLSQVTSLLPSFRHSLEYRLWHIPL